MLFRLAETPSGTVGACEQLRASFSVSWQFALCSGLAFLTSWPAPLANLSEVYLFHAGAGAHSTFVVANNHFRDKAVTNALQLLHLLKRTRVKVPPPLLQLYPEELDPIASGEGITPSLFPPG